MNKQTLKLRAYAKINLGLDVVRKREDGYHEVNMIMQTIRLYDRLEISLIPEDKIEITTNLSFLPVNEDNLVYKAVNLLKKEFNITEGVKIHLDKHIPVAAGLAGGSSDCAAALYGCNRLFKLGLSLEQLQERGVKLGADVPYCLLRGTALSQGIGEKLTALPGMPECYLVIAKPPISVSTKFVYENLKLNEEMVHPDIDGMTEGLKSGNLSMITERLGNVLETVSIKEYPVIQEIKDEMMKAGAINSLMSGSGPTVFGIFDNKELAEKANELIYSKGLAKQVFTVEPYNSQEASTKR